MMANRKTTLEERIVIAKWCLGHDKNYREAASRFSCSYSQVRNWTLKLESKGEKALKDGRGRKKAEEELSKDEKLAREMAMLEARNKRLEIEKELLKKSRRMQKEGDQSLVKARSIQQQRKLKDADYKLIKEMHEDKGWPIQIMCEILKISRAAYYKWLNRQPAEAEKENTEILEQKMQAAAQSKEDLSTDEHE